ncbi:helix-turn-helix domain-containing protein [Enterococcus casseliflavus]|uniref:helix-turn-helix domain-containing protein n=1 Tax=Enterococcus casseliflavus TaxID=37734 RepID=UPI00119DDA60|nr:helix-turn-helix domain-containing protein [Enterococcus casseliflavus]
MEQNIYDVMFENYKDLVGINELREMLGGIGRNKAYGLLKSNKIKYVKIGSNYKIPKKCVIEYLQDAQNMADEHTQAMV